MQYHDFLSSEFDEMLGWSRKASELDAELLDIDEWGELKRKIDSNREEKDILVLKDQGEKLNAKAFGEPRLDAVLLQDSKINHVIAKKAAENKTAAGFDLKHVLSSERPRVMKRWRRNIELLEKYDAPYFISCNASVPEELRPPRDVAAFVEVIGGKGRKSVSETPGKIVERAEKDLNAAGVRKK
ncbi:MAG: RNase P subunit p30 family protein [Candidatus Nanohaloarchaea archaeon]